MIITFKAPAEGEKFSRFTYQNGQTKFVSSLIDGNFPDYNRVIQAIDLSSKTHISICFKDTAAAIKAIKTAMALIKDSAVNIFSQTDINPIRLKFGNSQTRSITIDASAFLEVSGNDATRPVLMAVNSAYLLNMLKHYPDSMTMHQNGAGDPIVITGNDVNIIRVLMPMRSSYV